MPPCFREEGLFSAWSRAWHFKPAAAASLSTHNVVWTEMPYRGQRLLYSSSPPSASLLPQQRLMHAPSSQIVASGPERQLAQLSPRHPRKSGDLWGRFASFVSWTCAAPQWRLCSATGTFVYPCPLGIMILIIVFVSWISPGLRYKVTPSIGCLLLCFLVS